MEESRAIARAYGGEPVAVRVVTIQSSGAIIVPDGAAAADSVGWPLRDLFFYEHVLFRNLQEAYAHGDGDALNQLWDHAKPYTAAMVK